MHDINAKYKRHFLSISIDPMTIEGASTIRTKMNTAKAFLASTNEYNAPLSRKIKVGAWRPGLDRQMERLTLGC